MEAHEPSGKKKNRRAKKASTKAQQARKDSFREAVQKPRTDAPPIKEVSWEEYRRAKKEEKKHGRQHAKLKTEGKKKPYLQERDNCPALGKMRDDACAPGREWLTPTHFLRAPRGAQAAMALECRLKKHHLS